MTTILVGTLAIVALSANVSATVVIRGAPYSPGSTITNHPTATGGTGTVTWTRLPSASLGTGNVDFSVTAAATQSTSGGGYANTKNAAAGLSTSWTCVCTSGGYTITYVWQVSYGVTTTDSCSGISFLADSIWIASTVYAGTTLVGTANQSVVSISGVGSAATTTSVNAPVSVNLVSGTTYTLTSTVQSYVAVGCGAGTGAGAISAASQLNYGHWSTNLISIDLT